MAGDSNKRFLVVGRVGDRSLHKSWIADKACARNWDLQLNSYGSDESLVQDGDLPVVYDRGTKLDSLVRHFQADPDLLNRYDYVMLPDDDILMDAQTINRFFDICVEYDLCAAQPSLTIDSHISHAVLLNCSSYKLRYINYIEGQASCFRSEYLKRLLPILERFNIGWGIDIVSAMLMEEPAFRTAVVDACQMNHTRPLYSGALYKRLAAENRDPRVEMQTVKNCFEALPPMVVYGGLAKNGAEVKAGKAMRDSSRNVTRTAHRMKRPIKAYRTGLGLAIRSITMAGYIPTQILPLPGSEIESLFQ